MTVKDLTVHSKGSECTEQHNHGGWTAVSRIKTETTLKIKIKVNRNQKIKQTKSLRIRTMLCQRRKTGMFTEHHIPAFTVKQHLPPLPAALRSLLAVSPDLLIQPGHLKPCHDCGCGLKQHAVVRALKVN